MTTVQKILLIEDDSSLSHILCDILSASYEVELVTSIKQVEEKLAKTSFDLIVIDTSTNYSEALSLLEKIKKETSPYQELPVIILANTNTEEMRCHFFQLGVDDFIAKPFSYRELLIRINQKLKRKNSLFDKPLSKKVIGNVVLDSSRYEVLINNQKVSTSVLEFNLLKYFIDNQNIVITRKQILKNLWNNLHVTERTVDTHIATIRKKINKSELKIETVYGAGYILSLQHAKHQNKAESSE